MNINLKLIYLDLIILFMINISAVKSQDILDTTRLKCQYKLLWLFDTINVEERNDFLILQIGKKISKCYSYYTFQSDSFSSTPGWEKEFDSLAKKAIMESRASGGKLDFNGVPSRRSKAFVYKNYPINEMTVVDGISIQDYIYKDTLHSQNWVIKEDTKEISGYSCQKAICNFRGRQYEAWFTPEIPVSDGPWKFSGLPGLITEVYDKGKQYYFVLTGIEKKEEPIVFNPSHSSSGKFTKTSRKKFNRAQREYRMNVSANIKAETGIDLGGGNKVRHYDLIERDY